MKNTVELNGPNQHADGRHFSLFLASLLAKSEEYLIKFYPSTQTGQVSVYRKAFAYAARPTVLDIRDG